MLKKSWRFFLKTILWFLLSLIVILTFLAIWLRVGHLNQTKINVLKSLPLPIAFVSGKPVFVQEYLNIKKDLVAENYSDEQIFSLWIENLKLEKVASDHNAQEFLPKNSVKLSGLEKIYWADVALKIYYNSNRDLNQEAYSRVEKILTELQNGENFKTLVEKYDEDGFTKYFGGLSGELKQDEILPEILNQIKNFEIKETRVIPSREGLHIIKLESKTNNTYTLRQIFLKTTGYEGWVLKQKKLINSFVIFKF